MNPNNFASVPFLAPFLKDAIKNDEIGALQYNKDMIGAYAILTGEIRLFDNAKSGTVANQFAIDPVTLGGFMGKVKEGLGSLVKIGALPTENTKFFQFTDSNTDMYTNQLADSAAVGSGISRVIYSSDRMSNAEIEAGVTDQYNTMRPLYAQFENFLNYYVNKLTKKYKWRFIFDGCAYEFEREKRFSRLKDLASMGVMLGPAAWASASGYEPQVFESLLQDAKWGDFNTLWQLPMNSNTANLGSAGSDNPGRPLSDVDDLSESGELNRDS